MMVCDKCKKEVTLTHSFYGVFSYCDKCKDKALKVLEQFNGSIRGGGKE
jgi:Zn finger protein HypA/HybF involved in hydrogenase expression